MEFLRGLQSVKARHRGAAITIGSFDGIHLGHGALIASTCGLARSGRLAMCIAAGAATYFAVLLLSGMRMRHVRNEAGA